MLQKGMLTLDFDLKCFKETILSVVFVALPLQQIPLYNFMSTILFLGQRVVKPLLIICKLYVQIAI